MSIKSQGICTNGVVSDDVTVKPKNYNEGGVKPKYRNVASAVVWKRRQLGGKWTGL